jgi:predicted nucleic acid-binding protein
VRFVDTNLLLYSISREETEREKAAVANALLSERDLALSAQVLQEFYVQATRATRPDRISVEQAADLVDAFRRFPVGPVTAEVVSAAITSAQRFGIAYWDAAIIETARSMGCDTLLSEDLSDGQDYAGVRVVNPFI